jgi:hypothetical protein
MISFHNAATNTELPIEFSNDFIDPLIIDEYKEIGQAGNKKCNIWKSVTHYAHGQMMCTPTKKKIIANQNTGEDVRRLSYKLYLECRSEMKEELQRTGFAYKFAQTDNLNELLASGKRPLIDLDDQKNTVGKILETIRTKYQIANSTVGKILEKNIILLSLIYDIVKVYYSENGETISDLLLDCKNSMTIVDLIRWCYHHQKFDKLILKGSSFNDNITEYTSLVAAEIETLTNNQYYTRNPKTNAVNKEKEFEFRMGKLHSNHFNVELSEDQKDKNKELIFNDLQNGEFKDFYYTRILESAAEAQQYETDFIEYRVRNNYMDSGYDSVYRTYFHFEREVKFREDILNAKTKADIARRMHYQSYEYSMNEARKLIPLNSNTSNIIIRLSALFPSVNKVEMVEKFKSGKISYGKYLFIISTGTENIFSLLSTEVNKTVKRREDIHGLIVNSIVRVFLEKHVHPDNVNELVSHPSIRSKENHILRQYHADEPDTRFTSDMKNRVLELILRSSNIRQSKKTPINMKSIIADYYQPYKYYYAHLVISYAEQIPLPLLRKELENNAVTNMINWETMTLRGINIFRIEFRSEQSLTKFINSRFMFNIHGSPCPCEKYKVEIDNHELVEEYIKIRKDLKAGNIETRDIANVLYEAFEVQLLEDKDDKDDKDDDEIYRDDKSDEIQTREFRQTLSYAIMLLGWDVDHNIPNGNVDENDEGLKDTVSDLITISRKSKDFYITKSLKKFELYIVKGKEYINNLPDVIDIKDLNSKLLQKLADTLVLQRPDVQDFVHAKVLSETGWNLSRHSFVDRVEIEYTIDQIKKLVPLVEYYAKGWSVSLMELLSINKDSIDGGSDKYKEDKELILDNLHYVPKWMNPNEFTVDARLETAHIYSYGNDLSVADIDDLIRERSEPGLIFQNIVKIAENNFKVQIERGKINTLRAIEIDHIYYKIRAFSELERKRQVFILFNEYTTVSEAYVKLKEFNKRFVGFMTEVTGMSYIITLNSYSTAMEFTQRYTSPTRVVISMGSFDSKSSKMYYFTKRRPSMQIIFLHCQ